VIHPEGYIAIILVKVPQNTNTTRRGSPLRINILYDNNPGNLPGTIPLSATGKNIFFDRPSSH